MKILHERTESNSWRRFDVQAVQLRYSRKSISALGRALAVAFLFVFVYLRYLNADLYFSFDYRHYISFFDNLRGLRFSELINGIYLDGPALYVVVQGTHLLFEVGFVFFSWVLVSLLDSPSVVYALIATVSLLVRMMLLNRMGVCWPINLLLGAYSLTLFESNALRLGCAVTCLIFMVYAMSRAKSPAVVIAAAIISASLHAQTAFFSVFFIPLFYGYKFYASRGMGVVSVATVLTAIALLFIANVGAIESQKLADYSGMEAMAGGVTLVSLLGAVMIYSSLWVVLIRKRATYVANYADCRVRMWVAVVLASLPSLVVLVLATEMGAVGGRLWQASFVVLCTLAWADRLKHHLAQTFFVRAVMALLLIFSVNNVIYRFPLSNFFAPLAPYAQVY